MGIHGIFKQIGAGERISLAKLSADHYTEHSRPFRLAIDISIWLFQIQSGKGGSNPALRTFYYRLLRLLTLNIHPLFVFDGPNKPLFKRNKKVGGPGVRVASVPEFLAKQLLKQFGFPWHVAPGEAEAECALLQREGVVDAVLSEDVDTLMFGSGVTLRNWTSESSSKTPTHVNVYRAPATKAQSGMDREGMILVALMSGGDYLPEGIPGCGPKVACDAARAGFGQDLCALGKRDALGLLEWKERLQGEIRTNSSKFFTRKNTGFTIPEDFPNVEVLGYYTHPCVSTPDKVARLRDSLQWDQEIDFAALRLFTGDAFDWRCLGGAKKFIRNLAPAMLVRELRLTGEKDLGASQEGEEAQGEREKAFVAAIHGKRNHAVTDGSLEYRISFTPSGLVPIDLSIEDEDDEFLPAGGEDSGDEDSADVPALPSASEEGDESEAQPASPSKKKRTMRPYDPDQPEKLWILKPFLQVGCPLLVEEYEAKLRNPKTFADIKEKARAEVAAAKQKKAGGKKKATNDMPANALMAYARVTKAIPGREKERQPLKDANSLGNSRIVDEDRPVAIHENEQAMMAKASAFKLPVNQVPQGLLSKYVPATARSGPEAATGDDNIEIVHLDDEPTPRPFARFASRRAVSPKPLESRPKASAPPTSQDTAPATPNRRKRRSPEISSPAASQKTILSYYSPSPRKQHNAIPQRPIAFVNLVSSSPVKQIPTTVERSGQRSLTPPDLRTVFVRSSLGGGPSRDGELEGGFIHLRTSQSSAPQAAPSRRSDFDRFSPGKLPDTVTKRRRKEPLKRHKTAPVSGDCDDIDLHCAALPDTDRNDFMTARHDIVEAMDLTLASPSPCGRDLARLPMQRTVQREEMSDDDLPSPSRLFPNPIKEPLVTKESISTHESIDLSGSSPSRQPYPFPEQEEPSTTIPASLPNNTIRTMPAQTTTQMSAHKSQTLVNEPFDKRHSSIATHPRRSPRHHVQLPQDTALTHIRENKQKKTAILLRQSLEGAWQEVDAETVDLSGEPKVAGPRGIGGRREMAWRKSGVEVLDLTDD